MTVIRWTEQAVADLEAIRDIRGRMPMRDELFEELLTSVREMSAIERGRSKPARKYAAEAIIRPKRAPDRHRRPPPG